MQHPVENDRAGRAPLAEPRRDGRGAERLTARVDERREKVERARGYEHGVRAPVRRPARVSHRELPGEGAAGVDQSVEQDDRHEHEAGASGIGDELADADLRNEISEYRCTEEKAGELQRPAHATAAYEASSTAATWTISAIGRALSPVSSVVAKSWNSSANHLAYDALSRSTV